MRLLYDTFSYDSTTPHNIPLFHFIALLVGPFVLFHSQFCYMCLWRSSYKQLYSVHLVYSQCPFFVIKQQFMFVQPRFSLKSLFLSFSLVQTHSCPHELVLSIFCPRYHSSLVLCFTESQLRCNTCCSCESGASYHFLIQFHSCSLAAFVLVPPSDLCFVWRKSLQI